MWIFTTCGFFSVTRSPVEPDKMQVRARVRTDLEQLMNEAGLSARIIETPEADYMFRIVVAPDIFEKVLITLYRHIDYGNFKNAVHDTPGQEDKAGPYLRVWSAMASLQPAKPELFQHSELNLEGLCDTVEKDLSKALVNPMATEKAGKKTAKRKAAIDANK